MYGPLLDRFGRKHPLYIGLSIYILASAACIFAGSINLFLLARFFQALTGCVASVAAMAMVRDFFPVDKSAKIISLLVLILGASPLLAPSIGSIIVLSLGWQWVFATLAFIVLIILLQTFFFLPEGHAPDATISLKPAPIIKGFREILTRRQFYIYALAGTFSFAGLFVYVAGSPAIFMESFHLSARAYGGVFAFLSIGFIGGSQLNHLLSRRWTNEEIFKTTVMVQVVASIFICWVCIAGGTALLEILHFFLSFSPAQGLPIPTRLPLLWRLFQKMRAAPRPCWGLYKSASVV